MNINKLIEVAECVVNDPQIGFAAAISKPVEIININGNYYELRIVLKLTNCNDNFH